MNDRQLRNITDGLGGMTNGVPREDGFDITVASEIMAVLCLATSLSDLKERLSNIIVGYTYKNEPVTCGQLKAQGAMAALLKEAIKPNLVQTLEGTPVFMHGGPFANIAHGCNSILATKMARKAGEYAITEAGFGADLGAEKFLDIKCRKAGLKPSAVVLVATIRALKMHGGLPKNALTGENVDALMRGMPNLIRHIENIKNVYHLPCVVTINCFPHDTEKEIACVKKACEAISVKAVACTAWADGGKGAVALAEEVVRLCEEENHFSFAYDINDTLEEKILAIVQRVYGGKKVDFSDKAKKQLATLEDIGYGNLPVCIAKTPYSFSDDPKKYGAPVDFTVSIRNVKISAGAGFVVALAGDIMTMPGLPKVPAAENIDIDENGCITGLF